jgi:chemosensory pili system protein ChpA (sensor histidine kinase/response regulator)
MEEISPELREVFLLEAEDHLRNVSALLPSLEREPLEKGLVQEIRRSVHTLKGAAAMVGFAEITRLSHRMEDLLDRIYEGSQPIQADSARLLFESTDALEDLAVGKVCSAALPGLYARFSSLLGPPQAAVTAVAPTEKETTGETTIAPMAARAERTSTQGERVRLEPRDTAPSRKRGDFVRVPIQQLDDLVKLVSELVIARATFEQRMSDFQQLIAELQPSADRLKRASHKLETTYEVDSLAGAAPLPAQTNNGNGHDSGIRHRLPPTFQARGFDALEFDRYTEFHLVARDLAETTMDIQTIAGELGHVIGDFDGYLNRQARLAGAIEDKLMRVRMVPLANLASRLRRTVRQAAQQLGKDIDLILEGEHTELDKTMLEQMVDPLVHLLRNAVDHGIEGPELRRAQGKPARGVIRLRAAHEGSQVVLQVTDDGAGIDCELLRRAAVARSIANAAQMSDETLQELVFQPGFSTAQTVSEISGRGVGLDVVRTQVDKFKGTVAVQSRPAEGTVFTIRLPMTLAITRALIVQANQQTFALPLDDILHISRIEAGQLEKVGDETVVRFDGQVYPVLFLGQVLGLKQPAEDGERPLVLVVNTGMKKIALIVDRLLGGREIVIQSLGSHLRHVHGVSGATVMGDGSVVLILNPPDLVRETASVHRPSSPPTARASAAGDAFNILVVDDSPSVRRVVSHLLKRLGWTAVTAKDGLEALELLHHSANRPDLVLLDIEMPRMDGYELLTTLRCQEQYRAIPVVMVTSRTGEKHRQKALELGASGYVSKPYQDAELVQLIRQLIHEAREAAVA